MVGRMRSSMYRSRDVRFFPLKGALSARAYFVCNLGGQTCEFGGARNAGRPTPPAAGGLPNPMGLFRSFLDFCISLQRCSIFIAKLKVFFKYQPKVTCLALFVLSFLINFAYFFVNAPSNYDARLGPNTYYRIWYYDLSPFGKSLAGQITTYIIYSIKDFFS